MITGRKIEEIEKIMGRKGLTGTKHLKQALRACGFKTADRLQKADPYKDLPELCIMKVRFAKTTLPNRHRNHWIIRHKNTIYDPATSGEDMTLVYVGVWRCESSYLEVWR